MSPPDQRPYSATPGDFPAGTGTAPGPAAADEEAGPDARSDPAVGPGPAGAADGWAVEVATAGGGDAELAADALWRAGAVAIEERTAADGRVVLVAATGSADPDPLVRAVAGRWPVEVVPVDPGAALDAWRPHARPVAVGRLVIRPPWVPAEGEIVVDVDPGRAFGSGSHPSTRLALAALDELVLPGDRVLDVGCGSGVLALAALAVGAAAAVGVDTDPAARDATRANASRNGLADRITVTDTLPLPDSRFDLVVANMLAPTLVELAGAVRTRVRPGGHVVLSGLLAAQRAQVLAAYPGLRLTAAHEEDGWLALVLVPT